jgi:hypothetical protein
MKTFKQFLTEIFDTQQQNIKMSGKLRFEADPNKKKSGKFSHVVDDPSDQTMVRKISHRSDKSYEDYVNFLKKYSLAQKNPHFPRIYEQKKYNYQYSKTENPINLKTAWKIEKLNYDVTEFIYEGDLLTGYERLNQILDLYIKDEHVNKQYKRFLSMFDKMRHYPAILEKPTAKNLAKEILESSAYELFLFDLRDLSKIKLKSYRIALSIIKTNADKIGLLDWAQDNMMVRLSQYGPQLVFVDPYFNP